MIGSLLVTGVFARPVKAAGPLPCSACTEFPLPSTTTPPTSGPQNITVGPDGDIWFTIQNSNQIGKITPASPNTISVYDVPTSNSQPNGIALGTDGNIWFTEFNAGRIGEINPSEAVSGTTDGISEYTLPAGSGSGPRNIAAGPDGTMWFTEYNANKIGEIIVSEAVNDTSGGVSEYPVAAGSNPRGIIEGPDGNIWFTEYTADYVGYLNPASPTTAPVLFPVDTPPSGSGPRSIDVGPGGYLWFTENNAAKVGKILAASPNTITEYSTPTASSVPARMTEGPDGNMWFSENGASQIASINPSSGVITEYTVPTAHSNPVGVITGPDHNIWFTENGTDKIGQLAVVLPTTTTLGSSVNPSLSGSSTTLSATVSIQAVAGTVPLATPATGTVTFYNGGTAPSDSIGTEPLSAGTATLPISSLPVGSDSITAIYNGDNFNTTSPSNTVTQIVQNSTTTDIASNDNPANVGDPVTFTATVNPSTATGTVTFLNNGSTMGTGTLSSGIASLTTTSLPPNTYTNITASYGGDTLDASSASSALSPSQVVNQLTTTTTLASDNNPSQNGQPVDLTATVTNSDLSAPGTATGTVTFSDNGITLATENLTPGLTGATATLTTSSLAVGPHPITATYGGDTDDAASAPSSVVSQVVNPGNTTTDLASSENPSTYGDSVTFTATVSPATATGNVTFYDNSGAITLGSGELSLVAGVPTATLTTSALSGGDHNITAVYGGDTNDDGSPSSVLVQVVNPVATNVGLGSSENASTYGDAVTFTATVSPLTATGSVTFDDGTTVLGTDALTLVAGVPTATLTTSALGAGDHNITAVYGGDTNDAMNTSSILVQVVNQITTGTALGSGTNPSSSGESVTFTATVTPATATGSVTFFDGTTSLGGGTLSAGTATLSTSSLGVGSHNITAVYGGDTNDKGSTSSIVTQVVQHISGTVLGSSLNPSQLGQSVTLTATVTPSSATGTVTFYNGITSIGSEPVSGGTATLVTTALPVGPASLTAAYSGDTGDTTSTSTALPQVVNQDTSNTVVTSSLNPSKTGESVTFTATVTPLAATGTVTFMDGASSLATERVTAGVGTFVTTTLALGSHSITAVYSGDNNDLGGTSPAMTQVVNNGSTGATTTLRSSANPAKLGAKITFTATVSPSAATGKVTFKDGTKTLGTATLKKGVATFSTTTLALGTHEITAVYAGKGKYPGSTSAPLAEKVTKTGKGVVGPVQAPLTSSKGSVSIDLIGRRIDSGSY
ncbi:MAG: Ig-like domain repeat protein [Candidatus Dormibacteria bacterium]